jgi:thiol-disulfide isomerase/thioredoxin
MKRYNFLTIVMSLVLGLTLFLNTGCKKKEEERTSNTSPVIADEIEPTQAVAQVEEIIQTPSKVKPAPDENIISEQHAFPTLEFTSLSGEQINMANLKGKVVLIDFWATWCGPCRRVMPDLVETYKEYHGKGFEIIGISLDKDRAQLEQYMQDTGITWQQYYDGLSWNNKISKRFGIRGIPHIVLLDKNGAVYFNTDYENNKPPLHGIELRNVVAELCSVPAP